MYKKWCINRIPRTRPEWWKVAEAWVNAEGIPGQPKEHIDLSPRICRIWNTEMGRFRVCRRNGGRTSLKGGTWPQPEACRWSGGSGKPSQAPARMRYDQSFSFTLWPRRREEWQRKCEFWSSLHYSRKHVGLRSSETGTEEWIQK